MLKLPPKQFIDYPNDQPPSGGCVLKRDGLASIAQPTAPAAFRRLCVETKFINMY